MPPSELNQPAYKLLLRDMAVHPGPLTWPRDRPPNADVLAELQATGNVILPVLLNYIAKKLQRYRQVAPRRGLSDQDAALDGDGMLDPADVFGDVICSALTGVSPQGNAIRSWNRTDDPLIKYLCGIASSHLSHEAKRYWRVAEDATQRPVDDQALDLQKQRKTKLRGHVTSGDEEAAEVAADYGASAPDAPVLSAETREAVRGALSQDPDLLPVIEWLCDGGDLRDIAEKYGTTERALYNRWHRAKPRLQALLAAHRQ